MLRKRNLIGVFFDRNRTEFIYHKLLKELTHLNIFNKIILVCNSNSSYEFLKNKLEDNPIVSIISYDNDFAEFGAMTEALKELNISNSLLNSQNIFFNDTIFFNFKSSFSSILYFLLKNQEHLHSNTPYIIGHVAALSGEGRVLDLPITEWVQTAIFVMNSEALDKISNDFIGILTIRRVQNFKKENFKNSFELLNTYFDNNVLSYHVGNWLFSGGWYQSKTYDDFDEKKLIQKIESIVLEKYLTANLVGQNVQIIKGLNCKKREIRKFLFNNLNIRNLSLLLFLIKFHLFSVRLKS